MSFLDQSVHYKIAIAVLDKVANNSTRVNCAENGNSTEVKKSLCLTYNHTKLSFFCHVNNLHAFCPYSHTTITYTLM